MRLSSRYLFSALMVLAGIGTGPSPGVLTSPTIAIAGGVTVVSAGESHTCALLHQKAAIATDAWRFSNLGIDTGRYRLAPDVRAFGVVLTNRTNH